MRKNLQSWIIRQQGRHRCHCGCGEPIKILKEHHSRGIPRFINGHSARVNNQQSGKSGKLNPNYKGGRHIDSQDYVAVLVQGNSGSSYRYEHRLVMERHLERLLRSDEQVHHINGNKQDNRLENLQMLTVAEHAALHQRELKEQLGEGAYLHVKRNICKGRPYREALLCSG